MSRRRRLMEVWAVVTLALLTRVFAQGLAPARRGAPPAAPLLVDLNRDGYARLRAVPGLGPGRAEAILLERLRGGPFRSLEDLRRVPGLGPKTVAAMAPHLTPLEH